MAVYFFLNDSFLILFSFWQVWYTRQIVSVFAQDSNNRLYRKRACWFIRLGIVLFERHSVCYENSSIASGNMGCQISKEGIQDYVPYVHHYKPRLVYFLSPFSKTISLFLRRFFQKILSLCMACIQERPVIKSGLWWREYGMCF